MNREVGVPGVDTPGHITASRRILAAILATMFVSGVITGVADERQLPEPVGWTMLTGILTSFLTFCWFRLDRDARMVGRSAWVNIAILLLEPVALPVYLLVSRPKGEKLRALVRLLGFVVLIMLATMAGMVAGFVAA
jgi:hypothetical protein